MWADTLLIVFISVCTALLSEGLTWLLVYRTEKYQKLKTEIEKQSKKCKNKFPLKYLSFPPSLVC
ncbi:calcium load-activated calcium channel-like [Diaphorina citri]|uniref:Calcium load-activated calcium channel-like n=1 Tax=Diaphorina citri TaxID=121845 RepID=A0A3Q0JKS4_DIACI|nr:calcium load-activated calcium channel-like [Diaphorina citri]